MLTAMNPATETDRTGTKVAADLTIRTTAGESAISHVPLLRLLFFGSRCKRERLPADGPRGKLKKRANSTSQRSLTGEAAAAAAATIPAIFSPKQRREEMKLTTLSLTL